MQSGTIAFRKIQRVELAKLLNSRRAELILAVDVGRHVAVDSKVRRHSTSDKEERRVGRTPEESRVKVDLGCSLVRTGVTRSCTPKHKHFGGVDHLFN
jgi:formate dehydrogenase assembly factor FdhD